MWEAPDRRVWFFLAPILALGLAFAAVPPDYAAERYIELALYIACAIAGVGAGILSIRERYSIFRPSHTLDESPVLFWLDVAIGCFAFGAIALWKIADVFNLAL